MSVFRCPILALLSLVMFHGLAEGAGEPFVEHMMPPSIARGTTTRVTLVGSELDRAIDLWTSAAADQVTAKVVGSSTAERATLDITTTKDTPLGLHGLRLATVSGLSNAHIFLIDDLTPQIASPEGENSAAAPIKLPTAIAGTLRPGRIDRWTIEVPAGEHVSFEAVSSRFGKDADPLLTVRDAQGRIVLEHDNDPGLFFDFRVGHTFKAAGRYTVELCDARYQGDEHWSYLLRMGRFPAARVAVPAAVQVGQSAILTFPELPGISSPITLPAGADLGLFYHAFRRPNDTAATWLSTAATQSPPVVEVEPNDTVEQATQAPSTTTLCGVLGKPNDVDYFAFDLKKGDRLSVKAETAALDSAADVELAVINADGKEFQRIDDVLLEEASLTFAAPKDGLYRLLVHDVTLGGGPAYGYRIDVRPAGPQIQLLADFSGVTLPQASHQSFPLILTRTEYTGPVQLKLVGAPAGVTLEPNLIPEGATFLMASLRAAESTPLGTYTLRVEATADANGTPLTCVSRTQPMIDRQLLNVDLIKYSLRENQRRLPPSLANRIAMQITPPAPFTFELPEPLMILVRYLSVDVPLVTTRKAGFTAPIEFDARGGQMGKENELRRQIYARFVPATVEQPAVAGKFFSRNLAQEVKDRIDVTATGEQDGRVVTFVRSFELDLKSAYEVKFDPPSVSLLPGEKTRFQLQIERRIPFTGPVTIEPAETPGVPLPAEIVIVAGQTTADIEVSVPADAMPRKLRIQFPSKALVGPFEEDGGRPKLLDLEVKMPPKNAGDAKK